MSKMIVEKTEKAKPKDITRSNDIFGLILLCIFAAEISLHYIHFYRTSKLYLKLFYVPIARIVK